MLMESRRVRERRLRPQAGCQVQRLPFYPGNAATAIPLPTERRQHVSRKGWPKSPREMSCEAFDCQFSRVE
jgi:hypothetical protein